MSADKLNPQQPAGGEPEAAPTVQPEPSPEDVLLGKRPNAQKLPKVRPRSRKSVAFRRKEKSRASGKPRLRKDGTPIRRATADEIEDRIVRVARLVYSQVSKHHIKEFLKTQYGTSGRHAESYISRAGERLLEESGRPKEQWVAEFCGLYRSYIAEPDLTKVPVSLKMEAMSHIRDMLGLDAPTKIAATTPEGEGVLTPDQLAQFTTEELEVIFRMRHRLAMGQQPPAVTDQRHEANGAAHTNGKVNGQIIDVESKESP